VDRVGNILAIYRQGWAPAMAIGNFGKPSWQTKLAVGLARTAAFFSNNQAHFSSRTVRFISGIIFRRVFRTLPAQPCMVSRTRIALRFQCHIRPWQTGASRSID